MRVVLSTTAAGPGGVWRHLADLAAGLGERGIEARVVLPLRRSLLEPADVWHLHLHDTYDLGATGALAARRIRGRTVLTEHLPRTDASDATLMPGPRTRGAAQARTLWKRLQFGLCDRVIAVGAGSAEFLRERYGLSAPKLVTVPNGVEPAAAAPWPGAGAPRFVALGSLIMQKGHDVLVRAGELAESEWRATVLGDGPHRERLRALADGSDRVSVGGWTDDVDSELEAAHALCMPSRWEAFPYAALEAMARGRPVIGARVDGLEELIEDGVNGALVPPDDPVALAAELDRLSASPEVLAEMGRAARRRAAAYSLDSMVDRTLDVYRSVGAHA